MPKPRTARRIDPKSRPPDGARPWDKLVGANPERHYTYVNPNDEQFGVEFYESLGYEQELRREGGVRPAVGKTKGDGSVITVLGQVLMSVPMDQKQALDTYGVGGNGGQKHIDEVEERILKPGGVDGLRGMHGVFEIQNETSRPQVEVERG